MKKGSLIIFLISLILAGCVVPSLNPLYTDKDLIVLPGLAGTWMDNDNSYWKFEKRVDNSYRLLYAKDSEPNESGEVFDVHIIRLANHYFMDLYPRGGAFRDDKEIEVFHYIPTHTISKVQLQGDSLEINMLNPDWIAEMNGNQLIFIGHEQVENGILLTANPKDLQRFISTYADDSEAFEKPAWLLKRYVKKESVSEITTARDTVSIALNTSTTVTSSSTTTVITPFLSENIGSKSCSILYFTPLSLRVGQGDLFQVNIVLDNPLGTNADSLGLWIDYNQKAVVLKPESSFELDTIIFAGWSVVTSYSNPSKGELYLEFKADKEGIALSGMLGKLEFKATERISVSHVRFRFNRWGSLPNTFMTYKNKDVLGKGRDHNDGTISTMIRIRKDTLNLE